jgi:hypothetical protein
MGAGLYREGKSFPRCGPEPTSRLRPTSCPTAPRTVGSHLSVDRASEARLGRTGKSARFPRNTRGRFEGAVERRELGKDEGWFGCVRMRDPARPVRLAPLETASRRFASRAVGDKVATVRCHSHAAPRRASVLGPGPTVNELFGVGALRSAPPVPGPPGAVPSERAFVGAPAARDGRGQPGFVPSVRAEPRPHSPSTMQLDAASRPEPARGKGLRT